jgi:hypothetical protein
MRRPRASQGIAMEGPRRSDREGMANLTHAIGPALVGSKTTARRSSVSGKRRARIMRGRWTFFVTTFFRPAWL